MTTARKSSIKTLRRGMLALLCAAVLLPFLVSAPKADAQVSFHVQIGGPPPVCPYGYYDYAPYACAPMGFYGPGYFYNGIFLGVGPWSHWGYRHGWGAHRFYAPGGGRYHVGHGYYRGRPYHGHGYVQRRGHVEHRGGGHVEHRGGHVESRGGHGGDHGHGHDGHK